jgi:hypothetical protein
MRDESKLQHKEQPRDSETDAGAFCGDSLRGALEGPHCAVDEGARFQQAVGLRSSRICLEVANDRPESLGVRAFLSVSQSWP